MSDALIGNSGEGFDHACSIDDGHGLWDPSRWRDGEPCPILVRGLVCPGVLEPVGPGSRKRLQAKAAAKAAVDTEVAA